MPTISGSRAVYLPSESGTIARVEDITPAQLTQSGATTGQGIVWNGTAWAPGTVGGALTVGTTGISSGTGGRLMYEKSDNTLGEISGATSDGTFLTLSGKLVSSVAGAASTPAILLTGAPYVAGTSTTSKPLFLIEPTGTASTNWDPLGTMLGVNAASGFTGSLLDLQLGGVSIFRVKPNGIASGSIDLFFGSGYQTGFYNGVFYCRSNNVRLGSSLGYWTGLSIITAGDLNWNEDTYLTRESAAVVQYGQDVNGDAVDQTVKAADGITGTNKNGGDLTLSSGNSTGSGSSAVIFKAPAAGASGTTAHTAVERGRVDSKGIKAGKIVIWGDPTTTPAAEASADCFYLYVDPADGNFKVMSGTSGVVTTLTTP